jgi:hypothetical protein
MDAVVMDMMTFLHKGRKTPPVPASTTIHAECLAATWGAVGRGIPLSVMQRNNRGPQDRNFLPRQSSDLRIKGYPASHIFISLQ